MSEALSMAVEDLPRDTAESDEPTTASGDRPLRILLPSYRSHTHTGGQGVYMRHISKALVDLGHKVDVISGPPYPELDPRVKLIKLPSLDLYATEHPVRAFRPWMLTSPIDLWEWWDHNWGGFPEPYTFGERLYKWMQDKVDQYDVIHDNQTLCWGLLKVRDLGIPVAGTIHHPITRDYRIAMDHAKGIKLKLFLWRWFSFLKMQIKVANQLDPIIVVSESTRRDVNTDFGIPLDRMQVVHHGIDTEQFHPMPEVKRLPNRLMATASADVPLKGLIYLIEAYAKLLAEFPDLELVVIGKLREGQTDDRLKALGIKDRVRFVSGITDDDITRLYAEATIAVCPSVYEGFGFPAGEAMACGVPVVSTNGGSLPEVVGDAGVVVQHSNADALKEGIADLLRNPAKRDAIGEAGRQRILSTFRWENTARKVVAIYHDAIAKHENSRLQHTGT